MISKRKKVPNSSGGSLIFMIPFAIVFMYNKHTSCLVTTMTSEDRVELFLLFMLNQLLQRM